MAHGDCQTAGRRLGLLVALVLAWPPPAAAAQGYELLSAAREAARTDRNAASARLFGQYLAANPGDRRLVLREYADQLIYSGRPERGLPLLEELLSWDLSTDERRQAQQSYALALLWSDQHRQALAAYDRLLTQDPANEDARLNRIRALQWTGRPDRAREGLEGLSPQLRASSRAVEIMREIRRDARPRIGVTVQRMSQADGLALRSVRIEHNFFPRSGATRVGAFYEHRDFRDDGRTIRVHSPGVTASLRPSDALQLNGSIAAEPQRGSGVRRTQLVYEAAAAILPSDRLRFDFVTARRSLDNFRSLQQGLLTHHYFASADYWPSPMLKLTLRGELTDFSDGNERRWIQAEAERRVSRHPNIFVGARATSFSFERQLDHGYFNPNRFRSAEITARGWAQIASGTWLELAAGTGPERSNPGGIKLAYWGRGKISHAINEDLEVSLRAERLSSSGVTGTGFSRNVVSASIEFRW